MKRTILLYGISLAALVIALRLVEYRFLIHDLSMELYIGTIAIFFAVLGVWAGRRLTRKKIVLVNADFVFDEGAAKRLGISARELEVLQLMSGGLSNQEIADKLFVSLNTIKTHTSNLFLKLEVRRRTQAIQKAKELRFIP